MTGAIRFCRYACPPNLLGYCGPDDALHLLEQGAAGIVDPDLAALVRGFEGAWPYLELIAAANNINDPMDARVVEAYWVGNALLDAVDGSTLGRFLEERFRPLMGRRWPALRDASLRANLPHHNFHVFVVYPWVGMLRLGNTMEPLHVLDRCRIRWGTVEAVMHDRVTVRFMPLVFEGDVLGLGESRLESALTSIDGTGFVSDLEAGDRVSLHWDWVCERIGAREVVSLERHTARALARANELLRRTTGSLMG